MDNKLVSVLTRTFLIGLPDFPIAGSPNAPKIQSSGSAFALDYQGKQYLITASHLIRSIGGEGIIYIFRKNDWNPFEVTVVGKGNADNPETDIAVLAANVHLPIPITFSEETFEPSVANMLWG